MSDTPEKHTHAKDELDVPIEAIDFTPTDGPLKARRFQPKLPHIIIGSCLLVFAGAAWFVLSARSVFIDVSPAGSEVDIDGGLALRVGPRFLVLPGEAEVTLAAEGYYPFTGTVEITEDASQTYTFELLRLPGFLDLASSPTGASVFVDGENVGTTPLQKLELAAGEHTLNLQLERYKVLDATIDMEGMQIEQSAAYTLEPDWAEVSFNTIPPGASVFVDEEEVGQTPLVAEILSGEREIRVKLAAHKAWTDTLDIAAGEDMDIPLLTLEPADGLVYLQSEPDDAGVLLDGNYQGQTPLEVALSPDEPHELTFFRNGYQRTVRTLEIAADEERELNVTLAPITSSVLISAIPADAELYVNGRHVGPANQTLELLATSQRIEIRKQGYVPYETEFLSRPGIEQRLDVELQTLEQARLDAIEPVITTATGQRLKLLYPAAFTMGASRREAGRQANEVLREVQLTKPFYIGETEVTNRQFKQFMSEHSSGVVNSQSLDNNNQPVVNVSWQNAALYCNWLSEQDGLPNFYRVEGGNVTGFNADSTGYRLPTEAEWAWSARTTGEPDSLLKFPWGQELPPPDNHGNYADISAASVLGNIISNYNDSYLGSAPVASFSANRQGLYDMGGNVAEWVHDYYGTTSQLAGGRESDPMGPEEGSYHVVRGSSWASGTVTDLRLSYRDYSNEPRDDVGFRIARYLE